MPKSRRGNPKPCMSPISAALTIHQWTLEHGRPPHASECRARNNLHHHQTYYRVFGLNNFSAGILPLVSSLISGTKMWTCLGRKASGEDCTNTFPDEGLHIRMCGSCRARWGGEDETPHSLPGNVTRISMREAGAGRAGTRARARRTRH